MTGRALIAWNLRRLRTERGLSQVRLAEASGVNRGHLRELERENVNITVDLLDRIADVLGVRVGALFDEMPEGAETPKPLPGGRPRGKWTGGGASSCGRHRTRRSGAFLAFRLGWYLVPYAKRP
jgi:DNA-binding XRE family transcriptional regulator